MVVAVEKLGLIIDRICIEDNWVKGKALRMWNGRDVVGCESLISSECEGIGGKKVVRNIGIIKLGLFWFEEFKVVKEDGEDLTVKVVKVVVWEESCLDNCKLGMFLNVVVADIFEFGYSGVCLIMSICLIAVIIGGRNVGDNCFGKVWDKEIVIGFVIFGDVIFVW